MMWRQCFIFACSSAVMPGMLSSCRLPEELPSVAQPTNNKLTAARVMVIVAFKGYYLLVRDFARTDQ